MFKIEFTIRSHFEKYRWDNFRKQWVVSGNLELEKRKNVNSTNMLEINEVNK